MDETQEKKERGISKDKPNIGEDLLEKYELNKEDNIELHLNGYCRHYGIITNKVNVGIYPNSQNYSYQEDVEFDQDGNPIEGIYDLPDYENHDNDILFDQNPLDQYIEKLQEENEFAIKLENFNYNLSENAHSKK